MTDVEGRGPSQQGPPNAKTELESALEAPAPVPHSGPYRAVQTKTRPLVEVGSDSEGFVIIHKVIVSLSLSLSLSFSLPLSRCIITASIIDFEFRQFSIFTPSLAGDHGSICRWHGWGLGWPSGGRSFPGPRAPRSQWLRSHYQREKGIGVPTNFTLTTIVRWFQFFIREWRI